MSDGASRLGDGISEAGRSRPLRADARRNVDAILVAAKDVFETMGVDAPVRDIAIEAEVGMGTLYRHFPRRADLIAAVFRKEIEACADAADTLAAGGASGEALHAWVQRYAVFIGTKRGLSSALHSGDPAYATLPEEFERKLFPAAERLLKAVVDAGEARADVTSRDLLTAAGRLANGSAAGSSDQIERMVRVLVDGVRCGGHRRRSETP